MAVGGVVGDPAPELPDFVRLAHMNMRPADGACHECVLVGMLHSALLPLAALV